MKDPLISIVIPVYNVEDYIETCFKSLRGQTYRNIEVLFVDDCSTDASLAVCERLCALDRRFRVLRHAENRGQGYARMTGLREAQGDFIGFVDSDDYAEPELYRVLYDTIKKTEADIACCNAYYVFEDGRQKPIFPVNDGIRVFTTKEALIKLHRKDEIGYSLWDKLFRKSIIDSYPMKTELFEDQAMMYKYFSIANQVALCLRPLYNYVQRNGSTMHVQYNPYREYVVFQLFCKEAEFLCEHWNVSNLNTVVRKGAHVLNHICLLKQKDEVKDIRFKVSEKMHEYDGLGIRHLGIGLWIKRWMLLYHYEVYRWGYVTFMRLFKRAKYHRITGRIIG